MGQAKGGTDIDDRNQAPPARAPEPLSPVRGFLLMLALLGIAGLALYFTTGGSAPPAPARLEGPGPQGNGAQPGGDKSDSGEKRDHALTDRQAIKRFQRLNRLRLLAYRNRDIDIVRGALTKNSPIRKRIAREIRGLKRDRVLVKSEFDTKSVSVTSNRKKRIELRQVVVIDPQFVMETGEDVTVVKNFADRDTVHWVLKKEKGSWLMHGSLVIDRRRVRVGPRR